MQLPRMALLIWTAAAALAAPTPPAHEHAAEVAAAGEVRTASAGEARTVSTGEPPGAAPPVERPIYRSRAARAASELPGGAATTPAAGAAGPAGWSAQLRGIGALAGVVGLILLLGWGYRVTMPDGPVALRFRGRRPGLIQIISRQALAPRQSLCLVRIGPRMVLLGLTPGAVQTLDVISDAQLVAELAGQAAAARPGSATQSFGRLLVEESAEYEAAETGSRDCVTEPAAAAAPGVRPGDRIAAIVAQLASARQALQARSA